MTTTFNIGGDPVPARWHVNPHDDTGDSFCDASCRKQAVRFIEKTSAFVTTHDEALRSNVAKTLDRLPGFATRRHA